MLYDQPDRQVRNPFFMGILYPVFMTGYRIREQKAISQNPSGRFPAHDPSGTGIHNISGMSVD